MTDRQRLVAILNRAARPKRKRAIVCYDAKWAGLPRITVYDPPSRKETRVRRRRRIIATARAYHRAMRPEQLALPL